MIVAVCETKWREKQLLEKVIQLCAVLTKAAHSVSWVRHRSSLLLPFLGENIWKSKQINAEMLGNWVKRVARVKSTDTADYVLR